MFYVRRCQELPHSVESRFQPGLQDMAEPISKADDASAKVFLRNGKKYEEEGATERDCYGLIPAPLRARG